MKNLIHFNKLIPAILFSVMAFGIIACKGDSKNAETEDTTKITWTTASDEAMKNFKKGLLLSDVGDDYSARAYFDNAIELDPGFAMAYIYRSFSSGSAKEFTNDTKKAMSLIDSVSDGEKLLIKINQTYLENDAARRIEICKKLVELHPECPRALITLGFEYQSRNEEDLARSTFEKAKTLKGDWAGINTSLGYSYVFNTPVDFEKGRDYLKKAADLQPELAFTHINLGDAYRALDDLENAKLEYSKAIEINPEHFISHTKRGHANSFLGNYEDARNDYQVARKYSEYGNQVYDFEAFTYLYEGNPKKCLDWLENQVKTIDNLDMTDERKKAGKYQCYDECAWIAFHFNYSEQLAKYIQARNELNLEIIEDIGTEGQLNQAKADNVFWEGIELALKGDYENAKIKAEANKNFLAYSTSPNKLFNHHLLMGIIHYKQADFEKAIEHFESSFPNLIYNKYFLAKAYEGAGKTDMANKLYQEVSIFNFNNVWYAVVRNEVKEKVAEI